MSAEHFKIRNRKVITTYKLPISLDTDLRSALVKTSSPNFWCSFSWKNNCFIVILEYAFLIFVMLRLILLKATSDLYPPFAFYEAFVSRGEWR